MSDDLIGQQFGSYRLVQLLGRGGFAQVYLGQHVRLTAQQAAVKVLHAQFSEKHAEDLLREAETIAALKHPNIVRLLDFNLQNDTPFMVMDYAPNGSLRQRHPRSERVPLDQVIRYVIQVAEALQYAHDRKLIHRDIKPENMLIGSHNEILVSDFGIVAIAHGTSSLGTQGTAGTFAYMAPEQIGGKPVVASDQYALAITVFEWLCGKLPFQGGLSELLAQHLTTPPPAVRSIDPTLPKEIDFVLQTALSKDPKARFVNIHAFATALQQCGSTSAQHISSIPLYGLPSLLSGPLLIPTQPAPVVLPPTLAQPTIYGQSSIPTSLTTSERSSADIPSLLSASSSEMDTRQSFVISSRGQTDVAVPTEIVTRSPKSRTTRRAVIRGAVGVVGIVLVGGTVWYTRSSSSQTKASPQAKPSPTLAPGALIYKYTGHTNIVQDVAWSPDGKRIASASRDNTVQVFDATDGGHVFTFRGHSAPVRSVTWSPDGTHIASGSGDNTVQVWRASDGGNVYVHRGHAGPVESVAWSPDGSFIVSGSVDGTAQVWVANGGNVFGFNYHGHSGGVLSVAWSPTSKRVVSTSFDKTAQVWDATSGNNPFVYRKHLDYVLSAAWSPDGKRIATSSADRTAQVWDASDGGNVYTYHGHFHSVERVAWSPDNKRIASGSDDATVQVWDEANGSNAFIYRGHTTIVQGVAWSLDGKRIATGSWDNTVQVWEAP